MENSNEISFKFKNDKIYNIISLICFLLLISIIIVIAKSNNTIIIKILFLLLTFIILNILLFFISKKICIISGKFLFNKKVLIYENFSSEYNLNYSEIEYITKEIYVDNTGIIKTQNYLYKIKIKNSGYFIFKYYDDSLCEAIEMLSIKSNKKIDENY